MGLGKPFLSADPPTEPKPFPGWISMETGNAVGRSTGIFHGRVRSAEPKPFPFRVAWASG